MILCFQEVRCPREDGRGYLDAVGVQDVLECGVLLADYGAHLFDQVGEDLRVVYDEPGQAVFSEEVR